MIHSQYAKEVVLAGPATIASGATASVRLDTLGYKYCVIDAIGPIASSTTTTTNQRFSVLFVAQSDSTTYAVSNAISSFTGTTNTVTAATAQFLIVPNGDTSVGSVTKFGIDLRNNRGRYLFVVYQGNSSHSTATIKAQLFKGDSSPNTDTTRGVAASSFA
jgi:hypothetical protein